MHWNPLGQEIAAATFGPLQPDEVLYEFDGPKLYVARFQHRPLLVYESGADDDAQTIRMLVVPTSIELVERLKEGAMSVYDVLDQPWLHAVDQSYEGDILRAWYLTGGLASVPLNARPSKGALLWSHLAVDRKQQRSSSVSRGDVVAIARVEAEQFIDSLKSVQFSEIPGATEVSLYEFNAQGGLDFRRNIGRHSISEIVVEASEVPVIQQLEIDPFTGEFARKRFQKKRFGKATIRSASSGVTEERAARFWNRTQSPKSKQ